MNRFAYSGLFALTLASIIAALVFLFPVAARSQNPEWMNFYSGERVCALADDGEYLWAGGVGLTRLNKATGEMVFYNKVNSELPSNYVTALAIDAQGNLWIGTWGGGLARFDGVSWKVYNTSNSGLPNNAVWALAIDAQGNKWIGTWGGGLAVYREGGVILGVEEKDRVTALPTHFVLAQNYPNPFNATTRIQYQLPKGVHVVLNIYNLLGQKVRTLVDEFQAAGYYNVEFRADDLASGFYFYQLLAGTFVKVKPMLLIK